MRLGVSPANSLQATTLWDAFVRMKFDAATISSEDLPDVDTLPAAAKAMLTCANVTHQNYLQNGKDVVNLQNGLQVAPPVLYKNLKAADGRKIVVAVIGLLGDTPYQTAPNPTNSGTNVPWKVIQPAEALAKVLPAARKKANVVVVMYAGTRGPGRDLLTKNPDIDVMIVGLEGSVDHRVDPVGKSVLVQNAERGRYAGQLGITLDKQGRPASYDLRNYTLDSAYADDPDMVTFLKEYREKLIKAQTPVTPVVTTPVARSEWAGSYMCSSCHVKEFEQWKSTKHFIAMATLEAKDGGQPAKRSDCVKCHVVAFDKPGGYTFAQPSRWDLKGVGCEACHGPSAAHVDAQLHKTPDTKKPVANPGEEVCRTCHDSDNSPTFDFATYRPKIVHVVSATAK